MAAVMPRLTVSRSLRSSSTSRQTTVATSSVLCISSGMCTAVERSAGEDVGDLVEARAELERGRVEEHELLLDAQRERLSPAECVLRCARHRVSIAPPVRGRNLSCGA